MQIDLDLVMKLREQIPSVRAKCPHAVISDMALLNVLTAGAMVALEYVQKQCEEAKRALEADSGRKLDH